MHLLSLLTQWYHHIDKKKKILLILTHAIIFVVLYAHIRTIQCTFFNQILVCFVTAKKNSNNNKDKREVEKREPRKFLFVLIDIHVCHKALLKCVYWNARRRHKNLFLERVFSFIHAAHLINNFFPLSLLLYAIFYIQKSL